MKLVESKETGIYAIHNRRNDFIYFGSAYGKQGFKARCKSHVYLLNKQKHHSWILQRDWIKYGEDLFDFHIVELCPPDKCIEFEQNWINIRGVGEANKSYNINPIAQKPPDNRERMRELLSYEYVITFPDGHTETTNRLKQFCKDNNLSVDAMRNVAKGISPNHKLHLCDYVDENLRQDAALKRSHIQSNIKEWIVTHPNGKIEEVYNLHDFCREHNLRASNMVAVATGRYAHAKHFICEYKDENKRNFYKDLRLKLPNKNKHKKKCFIKCPNGEELIVYNLTEFCKNHNLRRDSMNHVLSGKRNICYGYTGHYIYENG